MAEHKPSSRYQFWAGFAQWPHPPRQPSSTWTPSPRSPSLLCSWHSSGTVARQSQPAPALGCPGTAVRLLGTAPMASPLNPWLPGTSGLSSLLCNQWSTPHCSFPAGTNLPSHPPQGTHFSILSHPALWSTLLSPVTATLTQNPHGLPTNACTWSTWVF